VLQVLTAINAADGIHFVQPHVQVQIGFAKIIKKLQMIFFALIIYQRKIKIIK
jgi:hypothetical protein